MHTLCTICARGGSRAVPRKNVRILAGHPLIAYTIAIARSCDFLADVVLSTEDSEISELGTLYGATPIRRPIGLASDEAGKIPVLRHAVASAEAAAGQRYEFVVDLQPTSPVRTVDDIRDCWELVQHADTDVAVTVAPAHKNPYFDLVELNEELLHVSKRTSNPLLRRQDAPVVYQLTGSVYAYKRDYLMNDGRVLGERTRAIQVPEERAIDIDTELDWLVLETLIRTGRVVLPSVTVPGPRVA